jgi:hypothetical protein
MCELKGLPWIITRVVFPHCDNDDVGIMICTKKMLYSRLEFTYMFYPGREYFYIGWKNKELYRKEIKHDVQ